MRQRRFLVPSVPDLAGRRATLLNTAYLVGAPGWTVTLCRAYELDERGNPGPGRLTMDVRGPHGAPEALQYSGPLDPAVGAALFAAAPAKAFRSRYALDDQWSLDVYHLQNEGLAVAVGRFAPDMSVLRVPSWCGREITDDPAFSDLAIAEGRAAAR
ncbi:CYTH domain-containing protein [Motilibacter deserti]|uniref:RES domain-containing protein n=1 Tax=Motilibacter deserti TaxID=2714956 RepID=A0ABX0GS85_9ACTN|nr:hypothetical protein [Motilibacter deserti]NHC13722.1 hypothetical protein [Motilibacter deserti]